MEGRLSKLQNEIRKNLFNGESSAQRKACIRNENSKLGGGRDKMPGLKGE
jgi:hypothetical protein